MAHGAVDQRGGHVLVAEHAPQPENPMFVAWMTLRVSWESDMTWNRSPEPSSSIGMQPNSSMTGSLALAICRSSASSRPPPVSRGAAA